MFISFLIEWCLEMLRIAPGCGSGLVALGIVSLGVAICVTWRLEQGRNDSDP
ncbi:unnamed protein product [marine sediment metagenome]|uniref:Uncharacterized protein n=1 Tax=marine sediment metagenome TaxID=412755 RepID=X1CW08_9ZZZZ